METTTKSRTVVRRTVKAGDIPASWQVDLSDDPEMPVNVLITPAAEPSHHRFVDFFGAGKGVYGTPEQADAYLRDLRDEWED